ncbi:MAG TPA: alpha/beta fold hydrolase [Vicinamibacterales bacterium]|nr:alpha/beta fold hydrolase [Vicinamibacterales bacterium]
MRFIYCTCAVLLLLAAPAAAQQAQATATATAKPTAYTVFLRGTPIGREEVTIQEDASGITITSQGRLAAPLNIVTRRAELKYKPDWTPERFSLEGTSSEGDVSVRTSFTDGSAVTEGTRGAAKFATTHQVAPQAIVLPNALGVFSSYTALARRLTAARANAEMRAYILPVAEIGVRVVNVQAERIQVGTSFLDVRRYEMLFANPGGDLAVNLTAGSDGGLIRVSIPAQAIDVMREDVASPTSRTQVYSNPGDEAVVIPAPGFNIGATLTRPMTPAARIPAVILLSGSGVGDRDGFALGIPVLAQLAGALADAGLLAVRYDKRGNGQSGGRSESATISDYADDARAVVRWLMERKDVDPKRIALVGHSEGAWVAILAAGRERRIAAVASIAGPSSTGAELLLEQQQHSLDQLNLPAAEREKRVAMQRQIQSAAITGKGWESVPAEMRKQADTPWLQSFVAFDPSRVLDDVRAPLLFVHGELDRQIPVAHLDRLAGLARKLSDSKSVDVVVVRGVNHLLVPATTGEVSEYGTLTDRNVSKDVTMAVSSWLTRTFAAIR